MVAVTTGAERRRAGAHRFYVGMAALFVLIAFGGFVPTYWARLVAGDFHAPPIVHLHGALFFAWTIFYFAQTWMVYAGRTPNHRMWGMAGISLATFMAITVILASVATIRFVPPAAADGVRQFTVVPITALVVFIVVFAMAIANVKKPEVHKRLMLVAMVPLMHAAIFRVWKTTMFPDGPPSAAMAGIPGLMADLIIVAAMVYDWRTRGKIHSVYLIWLSIVVVQEFANAPLATSAAWMTTWRWIETLFG